MLAVVAVGEDQAAGVDPAALEIGEFGEIGRSADVYAINGSCTKGAV
jgi:hypothetical protein